MEDDPLKKILEAYTKEYRLAFRDFLQTKAPPFLFFRPKIKRGYGKRIRLIKSRFVKEIRKGDIILTPELDTSRLGRLHTALVIALLDDKSALVMPYSPEMIEPNKLRTINTTGHSFRLIGSLSNTQILDVQRSVVRFLGLVPFLKRLISHEISRSTRDTMPRYDSMDIER